MRAKKVTSLGFVTLLLCFAVSAQHLDDDDNDCEIVDNVKGSISEFVSELPRDYKVVAWLPHANANTSSENCSEKNPLEMAIESLGLILTQLHTDRTARERGDFLLKIFKEWCPPSDKPASTSEMRIPGMDQSDSNRNRVFARRIICLCRTDVYPDELAEALGDVMTDGSELDNKCPSTPTKTVDIESTASFTSTPAPAESTTAGGTSCPTVSDYGMNEKRRADASTTDSPRHSGDVWKMAALFFMATTGTLALCLVVIRWRHPSECHRPSSNHRPSSHPPELENLMGSRSAAGAEADNQSDADTVDSLV